MLKIDSINSLEIDVTYKCNLKCFNCDRLCNLASGNSDDYIDVSSIERLVSDSIMLRWPWKEWHVVGGEPTLHPELRKIVWLLAEYKRTYNNRLVLKVFSNGILSDKLSGLDPDAQQVISSNNNVRKHRLVTVAPIDLDIYEPENNRCEVPSLCGICLNKDGYFPCGPGAAIARVFGEDCAVKSLSASIKDSLLEVANNNLCKYCGNFFSCMADKPIVFDGVQPVSQTWKTGILEHNRKKNRPSSDRVFSVVIPAADYDYLSVTLEVLSMHENRIKEVIVVEDASTDEATEIRDLSKKFGSIYCRVPGKKINRFDIRQKVARTIGQCMASGEITLFLDQDTFPCSWYFERLLEIHEKNEDVVCFTPRINLGENAFDARRSLQKILSLWLDRTRSCSPKIYDSFAFESEWGSLAVMCSDGCSVRTKHISKIGNWENLFGFGEEDTYWGYKAVCNAGLKLATVPDKGLFLMHMNHDRPYYRPAFPVINRLFLYEKDPSFNREFQKLYERNPILEKTDWCFYGMNYIKKYGIELLDGYECFPEIPSCLDKYKKSRLSIDTAGHF